MGSHTVLKSETQRDTAFASRDPQACERRWLKVSRNEQESLESLMVWLVTHPGRCGKFFSSGKGKKVVSVP